MTGELVKVEGPRTLFAVVGTQRSGTTLIKTTLDSHPEITCLGEVFLVRRVFRKFPKRDYGVNGYRWWLHQRPIRRVFHVCCRPRIVKEYLAWLEKCSRERYFGIKIMWDQAERNSGIVEFLRDRQVRLIHVQRTNALKSVVSREAAQTRGIHHSSDVVETPKVHVNVSRLIYWLNRIETHNRMWSDLSEDLPYLLVPYEEYVLNPVSWNAKLLTFLGISEQASLSSSLRKVTPNSFNEVVANLEEVTACLKGTKFEWMLEDEV